MTVADALATRARWRAVPGGGGGRTSVASADTFIVDWERSFHRLPLRQRAVVVLHFHYRYTLDDCAALMGCRPGTARQHLARALASLRRESLHD